MHPVALQTLAAMGLAAIRARVQAHLADGSLQPVDSKAKTSALIMKVDGDGSEG